MWGEHSKSEYKLIMLFVCAFCAIAVLGNIFPFIETMMTTIIVVIILAGVIGLIWNWIDEAREMHHIMNAPVEELIKEDDESQ